VTHATSHVFLRLVYEVWESCHVTHVVTFRQMQYFILNIVYISLCIPEVVQHTLAGALGHTNGVIVCGNKAKETEKMGAGGMSAEPACMCLPIVDGLPDGSSDVPGLIAPHEDLWTRCQHAIATNRVLRSVTHAVAWASKAQASV
jgi:hypothetical protein